MYGSRSEQRDRKELSIYMKGDSIYFGDKGENISLLELQDPAKYLDRLYILLI